MYFIAPVFFSLLMVFSETCSPYFIKIIIDKLQQISVSGNDQPFWSVIIYPALLYLVLTELVNTAFRIRDWFKIMVMPDIKGQMVIEIYSKLLQHKYKFFQDEQSGSLSNKISDLYKGADSIVNFTTDVMIWRILSVFSASCFIFFINKTISLTIFCWGMTFIYVTLKYSKKTEQYSINFASSRSNLFGKITDALSNILDVKSFYAHNFEVGRIKVQLARHKKNERTLLWKILKVSLFQGVSVTLFTSIVILSLLSAIKNHYITVGDFTFILLISGTIIRNIYSISNDLVNLSKEIGGAAQAIMMLSQDSEHSTRQLVISTSNAPSITLENVEFNYNKDAPAFSCDYLHINSGEVVALVGRSGGGKTTLINLLIRLFDINAGSILINDINIKSFSLENLRENIILISQEPNLFNRSIYDNIKYGNLKASRKEVLIAANKAGCHEFITKLPNKYETVVGERGLKLSGGQKQRIALARAFLSSSKIILLDEPTSALDMGTDEYIQNSFKDLFIGKTIILVAHRLSILKNVDRILVVDSGKIIQDGTHEYLASRPGVYRQLITASKGVTPDILLDAL